MESLKETFYEQMWASSLTGHSPQSTKVGTAWWQTGPTLVCAGGDEPGTENGEPGAISGGPR